MIVMFNVLFENVSLVWRHHHMPPRAAHFQPMDGDVVLQ